MTIERTHFYEGGLTTGVKSCTSVTAWVEERIAQSGIRDGLAILSLPHTTAGLAITSFWDERGLEDMMDEFDRNIPPRVSYKHQDSPFDAAAHVKNVLMRGNVMLMIKNGKMVLGSSQGLVFVEFDGPRDRKFYLQIVEHRSMLTKVMSINTDFAGMHNVTAEVKKVVADSGVVRGVCHVAMLHSTAGMLVTSDEKASMRDIMDDTERLIPTRADFKHRETASDAGGHVKTAIAGSQLSFAIVGGRLVIGEEQALVFAEYDGPRPRSYTIGLFESSPKEDDDG